MIRSWSNCSVFSCTYPPLGSIPLPFRHLFSLKSTPLHSIEFLTILFTYLEFTSGRTQLPSCPLHRAWRCLELLTQYINRHGAHYPMTPESSWVIFKCNIYVYFNLQLDSKYLEVWVCFLVQGNVNSRCSMVLCIKCSVDFSYSWDPFSPHSLPSQNHR